MLDEIIANQNENTQKILEGVEKLKSQYHELCEMKDERIRRLETENKDLRDNYEQYKEVAEPEIARLKSIILGNQIEINAKEEVIDKAKGIINKLLKFIRREENLSTYILEEAENFLRGNK